MRRPWPWRGVATHAVIVGVLLAAFIGLYAAHTGADANFGVGLVGVALLVFGLPWTLHYLIDPYAYDGLPHALLFVIVLGPAVFNVGVHALVVGLLLRRSRSARST